jgi:glutamate/tyrosine decarboxylase-like PLP-dependent enzyme
MDLEEYREQGKKVVDFIYEFRKNYSQQRVIPDVEANFLKSKISDEAPMEGENFDKIFEDFKANIVPYFVHWNHPSFHAYFPGGDSFPALLGDMLSTASNQLAFSWAASPVMTEHEQLVLNMYAKALDLPKFFLFNPDNLTTGGGAFQAGASDCILLALLAARARAVEILKGDYENIHDSVYLPQMVAYTSEEAHSCVQKAAKIAIIRLRILKTDKHGCLRGETVAKAIEDDVKEGLVPVFVSATVGTTGTSSFDAIDEIGKECKKHKTIWFHVDGAYGGNSFILPEMQKFKVGLEYADSFNVNPNKLLLTSFDCSCFWVKSIRDLKKAMVVSPTYLEPHEGEGEDLRHYGVPLSRRFRSLKLWCVLRNYGVSGLQAYIRRHMAVAKHFASLIEKEKMFSLENDVHLGLVCFKLLVPNVTGEEADKVNMEFLQQMNKSGQIHMVPTTFKDRYIIRFCVTNEHATNAEAG